MRRDRALSTATAAHTPNAAGPSSAVSLKLPAKLANPNKSHSDAKLIILHY